MTVIYFSKLTTGLKAKCEDWYHVFKRLLKVNNLRNHEANTLYFKTVISFKYKHSKRLYYFGKISARIWPMCFDFTCVVSGIGEDHVGS